MAIDPFPQERRALCCFCIKSLDTMGDDAFHVAVSRPGLNGGQAWFAHEACLAASLHPEAQFERDIYWEPEQDR